jgi:hypothetical protein
MIIVNIKGGLGNQMFQYAFGRALSLKRNEELKLDTTGLDLAHTHDDAIRSFALNAFNTHYTLATPEEVAQCKYPHGMLSRIYENVLMKIARKLHLTSEKAQADNSSRCYFDGYWHSPQYFNDIRNVLTDDFKLKQPLGRSAQSLADTIHNEVSVSIHIRRGDYVHSPRVSKEFGTCSLSYYQHAIQHIEKHVPNPSYFVFSDDIAWAQEHIQVSGPLEFISDPTITDQEALTLMSHCTHHIIANSSFSWWGAWLNTNPNKIVVAPTPWFNTQTLTHPDLIPETWITLPRNPEE